MRQGQGNRIEDRLRRFFKGLGGFHHAIDFETSTTCYEVKSCNLFNRCYNANHKRKFKDKPHKRIATFQHGRFNVIMHNHFEIAELAQQKGKSAKYIFVIAVENQIIWRIIPWSKVNELLKSHIRGQDMDWVYLSISEVFY